MERTGFTAEQVGAGPVQAENLIDPESLNNHRARFTEADLFCELKQDCGIDCVSRVRDEKREIHQVIQREIGQPKRVWSHHGEQREFSGRKQKQQG